MAVASSLVVGIRPNQTVNSRVQTVCEARTRATRALETRKPSWRDARADESDSLEKRESASNKTTYRGERRLDLELLTTLHDMAQQRATAVDGEN
jgi:hypothetical protein